MDYNKLIQELELIAQQLGIKIRYEKGNFDGGFCILKDQKVLVVNKKLFDNQKSSILARGIAEIGIDNLYIKPAVRQYIEDEVAKVSKGITK